MTFPEIEDILGVLFTGLGLLAYIYGNPGVRLFGVMFIMIGFAAIIGGEKE